MGGHSVGVALVQIGVDQLAFLHREQGADLGDAGIAAIQKQRFRLGGGLHGDGLARQVGQGLNITARHDGHDLAADHVRPGPAVLILAPVDGKAAPQAVDGAIFYQLFFVDPVDGDELRLVAHAAECLGGKLHIDAGGLAVGAQVVEGRVAVTADDDGGQVSIRVGCDGPRGAARQQADGQAEHGQQKQQSGAVVLHTQISSIFVGILHRVILWENNIYFSIGRRYSQERQLHDLTKNRRSFAAARGLAALQPLQTTSYQDMRRLRRSAAFVSAKQLLRCGCDGIITITM